jgi:cell division protein ZapA
VPKSQDGIQVEIYDQEYHMRGDLDPEYIQKLASFLDQKMRAIAARTQTVDSLRVAVLAALNLADEYHQLKAKYEAIDRKAGEFSEVLDEFLKQAV